MKYFIDTEFLEGKQDKTILGIKYGETKPTIDLISIGIVAEDGREYYAVSKDFNLKEAWNRFDIEIIRNSGDMRNRLGDTSERKVYWLRDNVLKSVYYDLAEKQLDEKDIVDGIFSRNHLKELIVKYGKTNEQIAVEIKHFCRPLIDKVNYVNGKSKITKWDKPEFYGYYSDYDWVVFCQLFGKMIDLPTGFPMYCVDLKQEEQRIVKESWDKVKDSIWGHEGISNIKYVKGYPLQSNEHHALEDARWNKKYYEFLTNLKL